MASFGSFETDREVYSDLVYAVYSAHKGDGPAGEYAVKVFRLPDRGLEAEVAPGAGGREEMERSRLSSIEVQEQAAQASRFIAPILEKGNDSRGLWYATCFYPRSVNKVMSGKVVLPRASLEHIVLAIAQGALDLKNACGRSHGDIRPSNVQVGKGEKLIEAEVVLCDPLPNQPASADSYEVKDLHAIGLILLQLVRQRILNSADVAVMFPIPPSPEWTRVFGADASDWLAVCNRLLDPSLSREHFSLEQLVARLEELRPKRKTTPKPIIALACALVVALPLAWWFFRSRPAHTPVPQVTPEPSASVAAAPTNVIRPSDQAPTLDVVQTSLVAKVEEPNTNVNIPTPPLTTGAVELHTESLPALVLDSAGRELGRITTNNPLILPFTVGSQSLIARVPGLDDAMANVLIEAGATSRFTFKFDYGTVEWKSQPVPVMVSRGTQQQLTPAIFIQKPGIPTDYVLTAPGYLPTTNQLTLRSGEYTNFLPQLAPEVISLLLISDPPGAQFFTDSGKVLQPSTTNRIFYSLPYGLTTIIASYGALGSITNRISLAPGRPLPQPRFKFDYGALVLSNLPPDTLVYEGAAKIGSAADKVVYQRPGAHTYVLRTQSGSLPVQTNIVAGLNYLSVPAAEKSWKNSFGIWFAWVPNLPGGGQWPGQTQPGGWVGISEITQGQYKKMNGANPSVYQDGGDNYPVENISWDQANGFCSWLNSADTEQRMGWRYALPTEEQFAAFAADSDRLARVTSEGRMTASIEDTLPLQRVARLPTTANPNGARTHPEAVASTKQGNTYGLYDVVGNVWEWLGRSGGKDHLCAGGSYLNFSPKTLGTKARDHASGKSPSIGFRVILVPAE